MSQCNLENILEEKYGYIGVKLPKEDITPLMIYKRRGKELISFSTYLKTILIDKTKNPNIGGDMIVAGISSIKTNKVNFNLGIGLMENLFKGLGVPDGLDISARLKAKYNHDFKFVISFNNVLSNKVDPGEIGDAIIDNINGNNPIVNEFDEKDEGYIITEILKSNNFSIQSFTSNDIDFGLDIKIIKQILELNSDVKVSLTDSNAITFSGEKYLTFGIKIHPFFYEKETGKIFLDSKPYFGSFPSVLKSMRYNSKDKQFNIEKVTTLDEIIDIEF